MNLSQYPTAWQRKTLWTALTAAAVILIGAIAVGLIWLGSQVLGFLQPILIPFAIAGVMAYLLDPVVSRIVALGTSRRRAVFAVFAVVTLAFAGALLWIVPTVSTQSINLARKVPGYTQQAHARLVGFAHDVQARYGVAVPPLLKPDGADADGTAVPEPADTEAAGKTAPADVATTGTANPAPKTAVVEPPSPNPQSFELKDLLSGDWLQASLLAGGAHLWGLIRSSLGGFLGVLGFLLSMIIVPIYLYYFLIEAPNIAASWQDYVPLRASAFKDEVVIVLREINGYLIAFFRGQLVVSVINGTITGLGLVIAGLDFGLLIGLSLCFLGIIPYLGITMCWIVSAVIASVQGGSWCVPGHPWWTFPLVISGLFILVHHFDGLFVTPKIVGESVGLHPLTVIFSVFVWSLLMGGLLGAILAVPMTATLKVLLRRYIWERRFRAGDTTLLTPADPLPGSPTGVPLEAIVR